MRMEMCRAEKYHSRIPKMAKLRLAETVEVEGGARKMLLEKNKQAESSSALPALAQTTFS